MIAKTGYLRCAKCKALIHTSSAPTAPEFFQQYIQDMCDYDKHDWKHVSQERFFDLAGLTPES